MHLPVILLVHHYLNDNHYLPKCQQSIGHRFRYCRQHDHPIQLLHHLADPLGDLLAHIVHLLVNLLLHVLLGIALSAWYWHHQLVLSWYHHQPESHQQCFNKRCAYSDTVRVPSRVPSSSSNS